MFVGPVGRCHALLIFHLEVSAFVDQELAHFVAAILNCIIQRSLVFCVHDIKICSEFNKMLHCLNVTFSHSVVDCRLPIFVLSIQVIAAQLDEVVNQVAMAFSSSVKYRCLLKRILLKWVDPHIHNHLHHLHRYRLFSDDTGREGKALIEVFRFVDDLA